MAYRFLLEVPEPLAPEASVAVDQAGDAQVILVRDSHGLGFDEPYVDLTVAAHSLRVIDQSYDWFDTLGASRPDIHIVLHSGERLSLEAVDRGAMVAAIRRDQPWVERSIPKVGEHEVELPTTAGRASLAEREPSLGASPTQVEHSPATASAVALPEMTRRVHLRVLSHVAVQIADLPKAEQFYMEFLNMELIGRARRGPRGEFRSIDGDYCWDEAMRNGDPADVSFVRNGPVTLALQRVGRGARIERGLVDHLAVGVDAATFSTLKAEALVRPLTVLASTDTTFTFRDPFGLVWELIVEGSVSPFAT